MPKTPLTQMLERNTPRVHDIIETCTEMIRRGNCREHIAAHLITIAAEEPQKAAMAAVVAVLILAEQKAAADEMFIQPCQETPQ